jgi:hypothetical protein
MDEHYEHLEKNNGVSEKHLKEVRKKYDFMLKVFEDCKFDPKTVLITQLDKPLSEGYTLVTKISLAIDKIPGRKFEIAKGERKRKKFIGQVTRNDYIKSYLALYRFVQEDRDIIIKNPFKAKIMKIVNVSEEIKNRIRTITDVEFKTLSSLIHGKTPCIKELTYFLKTKGKEVTERKNCWT